MRSHIRLFLVGLVVMTVTACTAPAATAPATATAEPSVSEPASLPPSSSESPEESAAPTTEPIPSDELGPFTCDLPIHIDATTGRALVNDVRIGEHDGYDRVVFEFRDGLPEASLERDEPPFFKDPSGLPLEVRGESFLRLVMRGGTKQQEDGTSSYDGSTDFDVDMPVLVHLTESGDFEAQSTWYLGLNEEACVRVLTLEDDGMARLVIDIEH